MATVKVRNVGSFDRDIRPGGALDDTLAVVPVGGEVEVSADVAAGLLEQPDVWQAVEKKSTAAAAADTSKEG